MYIYYVFKEKLNKRCPNFDLLDEIFGSKVSIQPPFLHDSMNDDFGQGNFLLTDSEVISNQDDLLNMVKMGSPKEKSEVENSPEPLLKKAKWNGSSSRNC